MKKQITIQIQPSAVKMTVEEYQALVTKAAKWDRAVATIEAERKTT